MKYCTLLSVLLIGVAHAQLYSPIAYSVQPQVNSVAHPAVVANAAAESQLPPELLNDQYKDPVIASALAKESLPTNKEMIVVDREAEKIPRERIFKIFKNAGWARKRYTSLNTLMGVIYTFSLEMALQDLQTYVELMVPMTLRHVYETLFTETIEMPYKVTYRYLNNPGKTLCEQNN